MRRNRRYESSVSCGDCGATLGQHHKPGCDMERCPFCLGQLISCSCIYKHLHICVEPGQPNFDSKVYHEGPNKRQQQEWDRLLNEKGLIPHVPYAQICQVCGELWPDFFFVPDFAWRTYVPAEVRKDILCRACYDKLQGGAKLKLTPRCIRCGTTRQLVMPLHEPTYTHYVPPILIGNYGQHDMQKEPMCKPCFGALVKAMPKGWKYDD